MSKTSDAFSPSQQADQAQKQLELLNRSQEYLNYVLAGILLQHYYLTVQKQILIDSVENPETFDLNCYPDIFQLQALASLLVLYALFGFYEQSKDLAREACKANTDLSDAKADIVLNETAITVSLIRFARLLKQNGNAQKDGDGEAVLQEELLDLPI